MSPSRFPPSASPIASRAKCASPPRPLDRGSLWQFGTSPYRAVRGGLPPSLAQHDVIRVFLTPAPLPTFPNATTAILDGYALVAGKADRARMESKMADFQAHDLRRTTSQKDRQLFTFPDNFTEI